METKYSPEIDINIDDFPDSLVRLVNGVLNDKDYAEKHNSRIALVKMGRAILPYLNKLMGSENSLLRMEPLLLGLDNFHELGGTAPVEASKALKAIYK